MIIDKALLDSLTDQAKAPSRLRMLNTIEPGQLKM